jgi:hypothetical protein
MNIGGRPSALTPQRELELYCYRKAGNSIKLCASAFRVSVPTTNRIIKRHGGVHFKNPGPTRHGHASARTATPTYRVWKGMLERCRNKKNIGFKYYGARGISVCESWEIFENFLADMGDRPALDLSLDRINNDGNYEPGNCRWATKKEQANNQRRPKRSKRGDV